MHFPPELPRRRCLKNKGADWVQVGGGVRSIKHSKFKRIAKFGLIVAVETAAFTVAENRMSDFLGMARISAAFGKYSGCKYAVNTCNFDLTENNRYVC